LSWNHCRHPQDRTSNVFGYNLLLERVRRRIQLCGIDPLVRDVLWISRLEPESDLCDDQAQALGLLLR
jgi:hypothetical protein